MARRDYKGFAQGEYHHVFNRGNNKMPIFLDTEDYAFFRHRLEEALYPERKPPVNGAHSHTRNQRRSLPPNAFTLVAYSLMPNHFHLLLLQRSELSISALILKVISGYSKYFNKKYERVGSLFQDQFKATRIEDDVQLINTSAYIHCNAPIAGLVESPGDYSYDSYAEYTTGLPSSEMLSRPDAVMAHFSSIGKYEAFVAERFEALKRNALLDDDD